MSPSPSPPHTISYEIEGIRPTDANGNYGYWNVSSYLSGTYVVPEPGALTLLAIFSLLGLLAWSWKRK